MLHHRGCFATHDHSISYLSGSNKYQDVVEDCKIWRGTHKLELLLLSSSSRDSLSESSNLCHNETVKQSGLGGAAVVGSK